MHSPHLDSIGAVCVAAVIMVCDALPIDVGGGTLLASRINGTYTQLAISPSNNQCKPKHAHQELS